MDCVSMVTTPIRGEVEAAIFTRLPLTPDRSAGHLLVDSHHAPPGEFEQGEEVGDHLDRAFAMGDESVELEIASALHPASHVDDGVVDRRQIEVEMIEIGILRNGVQGTLGDAGQLDGPDLQSELRRCGDDVGIETGEAGHVPGVPFHPMRQTRLQRP